MKIPNKFILGGQEITVTHVNQIDGDLMGDCCIWDSTIKIADNYKGRPQSDGSKVNTFYHELTHLILDTMGEFELSTNISTFLTSYTTNCISKLCKYRLDGDKRKAERQECRMECLMVRTLQQLDCIINEIEEL